LSSRGPTMATVLNRMIDDPEQNVKIFNPLLSTARKEPNLYTAYKLTVQTFLQAFPAALCALYYTWIQSIVGFDSKMLAGIDRCEI
jgi:hypothetical protein